MRLPGRGDHCFRGCCACWDCLPNILLQDADEHYDTKINQELHVEHVFGGQGCIKWFRRVYAVVPFIILAAWLAYNAWAATVSAEGLIGQEVAGSLAEVWAEKNVLRLRSFQNSSMVCLIGLLTCSRLCSPACLHLQQPRSAAVLRS